MRTLHTIALLVLLLLGGCTQRAPESIASPSATPSKPALRAVNADHPGSRVEIERLLIPGKINIGYFSADWCPDCKVLEPKLLKLAEQRPDVHLFKVDILDWESEVAEQFSIVRLPHVQLYNEKGEMTAAGDKAERQVLEMLGSS